MQLVDVGHREDFLMLESSYVPARGVEVNSRGHVDADLEQPATLRALVEVKRLGDHAAAMHAGFNARVAMSMWLTA